MSRFNLTNALPVVFLAITPIAAWSQANTGDMLMVREHVNKGNYLMGRRQFQQAIDEYNAALDIDAGSQAAKENIVLAHNNWGIFLFQQKKYDEAKAEWEKALQINPYDRNAKNNMQFLKATLARLGPPKPPPDKAPKEPDKDGKQEGGKQESAKAAPANKPESSGAALITPQAEENSTSAVMIIKPSKATSTEAVGTIVTPSAVAPAATAATAPAAPATPVATPPTVPSSALMNSSPYGMPEQTRPATPGAQESSPYSMPTNLAAPPTPPVQTQTLYKPPQWTPAPPAPQPVATPTPTPAPETPAAHSTEAGSSATLDDRLLAIESKVYGKKQKNMPMIKRVEKLETELCGKHNDGTLQERIEILTKNAGL